MHPLSGMTGEVNTLTADAVERLRTAERRGLIATGSGDVVRQNFQDIGGAIEEHAREVADVMGDPRLSEAGKNERRVDLYEATHERLTGLVNAVASRVDSTIAQARRRAAPTPSDIPPEALEAQLANARTDARMVLDGLSEDDLADGVADLAENGSDAMRHLILGTDWPALYFRSRDAATADALWANRKPSLMPLVLDEVGQVALHTLTAEDELRNVMRLARALRDIWVSEAKPLHADLPVTPGG